MIDGEFESFVEKFNENKLKMKSLLKQMIMSLNTRIMRFVKHRKILDIKLENF